MKNPLKETFNQLKNDPKVIEAGIIGTERTLIFEMIRKIKQDVIDGKYFACDNEELCDRIIDQIQNEVHRKDFD